MTSFFKIILSFVLFFPVLLIGQETDIDIQHITTRDGLSHRRILNICESSEGYIWMAANYGLNRYDGQKMKVYRSTTHSLYHDELERIHATQDNKLLLFYGLNTVKKDKRILDLDWVEVLDLNEEKIIPFSSIKGASKIDVKDIRGSYQDENFKVWIWTSKGDVFLYEDEIRLVCSFPEKKNINFLVPGVNGEMFFLNKGKLISADRSGKILTEDNFSYRIRRIFIDEAGVLWMHSDFSQEINGVRSFLFKKEIGKEVAAYDFSIIKGFSSKGLPENKIDIAKVDRKARIWMTYRNKIYLINTRAETLQELNEVKSDYNDFEKLKDVCVNRNGLVFLGNSDGLFIVNIKQKELLKKIFHNQESPVSTRTILDFSEDSLLVFSYGESFMLDKKSDGYRPIKNLKNTNYYRVIKDKEGSFWAGCHSATMHKISSDLSSHEIIKQINTEGLSLAALRPYQDPNSEKIWIAKTRGLSYVDKEQNKLQPYYEENSPFDINKQTINGFYQNQEGLWMTSTHGIYLYKEGEGIVANYADFPFLNINYIYEDTDGVFWLGTLGGGLVKWNRKTGEKEIFNTDLGFSNNVIYAVFEDDFGYLWLPSDNGIMQFNKKNYEVITYFPSGIEGKDEFNNNSYLKTKDGYLYFGGINGVVKFHPKDLNRIDPPNTDLLVTELKKSEANTGRMVSVLADFRKEKQITIQPEEHSFEVKFALLDFKNSENISYAYQVENVDDDWIYTKENFIRINRLPFGKHNLIIKGKGEGKWSSKELNIPIHVVTPVYRRTWFLVLSALLIIGLGLLLLKWRIQFLENEKVRLEEEVEKRTEEINEQNEKLEALVDTKDQFFGIIAHDLRGPMLSFRGLNEKLQYLIDNKEEERLKELGLSVDSAYSKLERLLDNLLNWALVKKGNLPFYPKSLNLYELANEVIDVFDEIAKIKKITIHNEIIQSTVVEADENALSSIYRNLLSNAIKYSNEGSAIFFYAEAFNDQIRCEIRDEGVGVGEEELKTLFDFDPQKRRKTSKDGGTGLGLQLCKELINLHQGNIWIESVEGKGTSVFFSLPQEKIVLK